MIKSIIICVLAYSLMDFLNAAALIVPVGNILDVCRPSYVSGNTFSCCRGRKLESKCGTTGGLVMLNRDKVLAIYQKGLQPYRNGWGTWRNKNYGIMINSSNSNINVMPQSYGDQYIPHTTAWDHYDKSNAVKLSNGEIVLSWIQNKGSTKELWVKVLNPNYNTNFDFSSGKVKYGYKQDFNIYCQRCNDLYHIRLFAFSSDRVTSQLAQDRWQNLFLIVFTCRVQDGYRIYFKIYDTDHMTLMFDEETNSTSSMINDYRYLPIFTNLPFKYNNVVVPEDSFVWVRNGNLKARKYYFNSAKELNYIDYDLNININNSYDMPL